jgi:phage terminase large subunit-like protein
MGGTPTFSLDPHLYPDPSGRADRVCRFVCNLRLWEGDHAGRRFPLQSWQEAITRRIYGPVGPDGGPLVRTAAIWIPRGNAKTTLAAGYALAHFLGPEAEQGGQAVMAAADRENAGIAFGCAHQMVQQDRRLASRVRAIESRKTLHHPGTTSTLKAISSEAYSKHGLNTSFFLADEVHAWTPAEARPLFKTVTDSMVKRSRPLTIIISTAGTGTGGLAHDWWSYSQAVARGEIDDPTFAPIIFAAPADADWRDEDAWRAANPAIDSGFLSAEELRIKVRRIAHFPAEVADFKRFHLNQWQEGAAEPWIGMELYDQAAPRTDLDDLAGRKCWIGVDLSSVEDLTAVVAVFPDEGEDGDADDVAYDVLAMFFLPANSLAAKAERDRADYLRWRDAGHLTVTEGDVVDYSAVTEHLFALAEQYRVQEVAIDRWNSTTVNTALQDEGLTVVQFGQGFRGMGGPMREMKRAILARRFRHGGNPVLRMCFANAVPERDAAENEKLVKNRARGRIDGAVASAMAIGRAMARPETINPYTLERRPDGLLII